MFVELTCMETVTFEDTCCYPSLAVSHDGLSQLSSQVPVSEAGLGLSAELSRSFS